MLAAFFYIRTGDFEGTDDALDGNVSDQLRGGLDERGDILRSGGLADVVGGGAGLQRLGADDVVLAVRLVPDGRDVDAEPAEPEPNG